MRTFPALITTELAEEAITQAHLYKITATATYYWTDCDQDIYFAGQCWSRKNIVFDAAQVSIDSKVDTIQLELENIDKAFSDWVLSEDIRGKEIRIYRIYLNSNLAPIGVTLETDLTILFVGYIDRMTIDRRRARITVYNHFIKWRMAVPRRIHTPTCQWNFKGTECGYVGIYTSCDKSWEDCNKFLNSVNFGGFRHLPEVATKEILWGTIAKNWHK